MATTHSVNDRVLCYHGPLVYEAKILKMQHTTGNNSNGEAGPQYFVHYKGWKNTWDEWVGPSRLLKHNEQGIALQKSLQAQAKESTSAASKTAKAAAAASTSVAGRTGRKDGTTRGTKRGRDEDDSGRKPDMKLAVPEALKKQLVDDWEYVTKSSQLVSLPRSPTVIEILQQFQEHILNDPKSFPKLRDPPLLLPTVIQGLQIYFDKALGCNLLYRLERQQYSDIRKKYVTGGHVQLEETKAMSEVYGAEHLARMLVAMPQIVASSSMDAESITIVREYVNELMAWMVKERDRIFLNEYDHASQQYQNIART